MKTKLALLLLALIATQPATAQPGRIYTKPDPKATGGIEGEVDAGLTHAIAVNRDREHVYLAQLSDEGRKFKFAGLPVGKYDLVLVSYDREMYEGLALGGDMASLSAISRKNYETRATKQDEFFNRSHVHLAGFDHDRILALVERLSTRKVLKGSGEALGKNLRRLEVLELQMAADDWQVAGTRHLYREGEPIGSTEPDFLRHEHVAELGNIRVINEVKLLGKLPLHKK